MRGLSRVSRQRDRSAAKHISHCKRALQELLSCYVPSRRTSAARCHDALPRAPASTRCPCFLEKEELPFASLVHARVVVSRSRTHRATALHTWGCRQEARPALQT